MVRKAKLMQSFSSGYNVVIFKNKLVLDVSMVWISQVSYEDCSSVRKRTLLYIFFQVLFRWEQVTRILAYDFK